MERFARVVDGIAVEIVEIEPGSPPIAERYHPDFVAGLLEAPDGVEPGWRFADGQFQPPAPPEEPAPAPRYIPAATLRERLEAQGKWDAVAGLLTIPQVLKLATLREGIAPDDAEMLALLHAAEVDVPAVLDGFA